MMYAEHTRPKRPSVKKGMRRRMRAVLFLALIVAVWSGLKWFEQHGEVQAKLAQLQELESQLEATRELNETYKLDIIRMDDPEYVEQLLRKELHMTKDGEKLFIKTQ